jgi:hypothetical protein
MLRQALSYESLTLLWRDLPECRQDWEKVKPSAFHTRLPCSNRRMQVAIMAPWPYHLPCALDDRKAGENKPEDKLQRSLSEPAKGLLQV